MRILLVFISVLDSDGERAFIEALYNSLDKRLLYVASSYLGKEKGEEAVQDVFVKLIEKFQKNIYELGDKQAYYFVTIVKNHCIDILRKEGRMSAAGDDPYENGMF